MRAPRTVCYVQGSSEVGGSDVCLLRLVHALDKRMYQPLVVLPGDGPLVGSLRAAGARVVFTPMIQLRAVRSLSYQARYAMRFWPTVWRLVRLIRRERVKLVHSNSLYVSYGAWAAMLAGVPHVWHIREIPGFHSRVMRAVGSLVVSLSSCVITMSAAVAAALHQSDAKVQVIADGIDVATFRTADGGAGIRDELGIESGAPLVGFVGRLDPWKGVHVFIRAAERVARRHPDARFVVCGGALAGHREYAAGLKGLAGRLGLDGRLVFTEWKYPPERIPEVMAALDVLVHTSVEPEPFGLVLLEAMASSKPVIASRAGGPIEIVDDGVTGILVPPGRHHRLASAILSVIADPALGRRMGEAGRSRAQQCFSLTEQVRIVETAYGAALAG